jgi:predicted outer membrane repeat protein
MLHFRFPLRVILGAIVFIGAVGWFGVMPARAAGVVGNGTPQSCTEIALDSALATGGKITFNCGANPKTIVIKGRKSISLNTTIDGGGKITFKMQNVGFAQVQGGATLKLLNITLTNARNSARGALENFGTLSLNRVTLRKNDSTDVGGAIANNATLIVKNSTFLENTAEHYGGAIYSFGGTVTIKNSTFRQNSTRAVVSGGGALNLVTPTTGTISKSTFDDNSSTDGGGIGTNGDVTISKSKIINNYASGNGGGIWQGGNLTLIDSTVDNNQAKLGGGIYAAYNVTTISNSTLSRNEAFDYGGGAYANADMVITNSTFSGNTGLYVSALYRALGVIDMQHVTIANNNYTDANGSGVYSSYSGAGLLYAQNTVIANNGAMNCGSTGWYSNGNNLSSDNSCAAFTGGGDKQNKNAKLGALANNGGPTLTHLPQSSSPLINKGANVGVTVDQRGYARPVGNADIGAVEVQ